MQNQKDVTVLTIYLPTVKAVKDFVKITSLSPLSIDLVSGTYKVDAKSLMGVFSLDLSSHLTLLVIHNKNANTNDVNNLIKKLNYCIVT